MILMTMMFLMTTLGSIWDHSGITLSSLSSLDLLLSERTSRVSPVIFCLFVLTSRTQSRSDLCKGFPYLCLPVYYFHTNASFLPLLNQLSMEHIYVNCNKNSSLVSLCEKDNVGMTGFRQHCRPLFMNSETAARTPLRVMRNLQRTLNQ